jgi:hypothetical protein
LTICVVALPVADTTCVIVFTIAFSVVTAMTFC